MTKRTSKETIERIMGKAFPGITFGLHGYPDAYSSAGFVECKAWLDFLRPEQVDFYNFLVDHGQANMWRIASEDPEGKVHLFKTPGEYQQFKNDIKACFIQWDLRHPHVFTKTEKRSVDGSMVYLARCPNPFGNPKCRVARHMTRKAVADSAKSMVGVAGICQSCASIARDGKGERVALIIKQAEEGTMSQKEFGVKLGLSQGYLADIVRRYGLTWKRVDGRATNKRKTLTNLTCGAILRMSQRSETQNMEKRTDVHSPSVINPDDYVFVGHECVKIEDFGTALFAMEEKARIKAHMQSTGGTYSKHQHGGNCMVCGSVNAIYTVLFYHAISNTYVRMGSDCTENMFKSDFGASIYKQRAQDARLALAGQKKAAVLLEDAGYDLAWVLYRDASQGLLQRMPYEETTIIDIVGKLVKYGSISEKQMKFIGSLINKINNRAAIEAAKVAEKDAAAEVPEGRIDITGEVLSTKVVDSQFGSTLKMLVKHESGWKVWGTVPKYSEIKKGDKVSFSATIEKSKDDPKFGFFSRPTGAKVLEPVA